MPSELIMRIPPNVPRISRRRVKRRAQQSKTLHITKTGNTGNLDQVVGCMRWLGRTGSSMQMTAYPRTVLTAGTLRSAYATR